MSAVHFNIFYLSVKNFQNFPGPAVCLQNFPVIENATKKFQDIPGFLGPVQNLFTGKSMDGSFSPFGQLLAANRNWLHIIYYKTTASLYWHGKVSPFAPSMHVFMNMYMFRAMFNRSCSDPFGFIFFWTSY